RPRGHLVRADVRRQPGAHRRLDGGDPRAPGGSPAPPGARTDAVPAKRAALRRVSAGRAVRLRGTRPPPRRRHARENRPATLAGVTRMLETLSKLGFLVMIAGLVGLVATHALFSPNPVVIGVQVAAALLMLWARVTFGRRSFHATASATAGGLVTTGPYRYIRHPI